jgi:hypothetical protein
MVLNKDSHREHSEIPGLDGKKLRKVSFCVDVEVAPCHEDVEARKEARRKRREAKEKEKEKERLKQLKEDGTPEIANCDGAGADTAPPPAPEDGQPIEKKQSGSGVPNGLAVPPVDEKNGKSPSPPSSGNEGSAGSSGPTSTDRSTAEKPSKPRRRIHPKPTTDPMKIYTQCCQLRETHVLPEVQEQLLKENCPAILQSMDLTGYRFQQADAVTFSDFLALVPIKCLILEDCDLTDEMVRMVLSALSAVKQLSALNESTDNPKPTEDKNEKHHRGVIERLSLKKNPKIGRDGWRYISCFVHMSHSLKALDLSNITLPRPLPAVGRHNSPQDTPASDITGIFARALGERLCGHGLEELVMGYCGLVPEQLKLVLAGVSTGRTKRLGLEGNALTDDGLAMIGRWMKGTGVGDNGVCEALDLSHNNIRVCSSSPIAYLHRLTGVGPS